MAHEFRLSDARWPVSQGFALVPVARPAERHMSDRLALLLPGAVTCNHPVLTV